MIFTFGHGTRNLAYLQMVIKKFNIDAVIDVRSKPHSRWSPTTNRANLNKRLKCTYLWKGDILGGFDLTSITASILNFFITICRYAKFLVP